jgi:hypothetical protein
MAEFDPDAFLGNTSKKTVAPSKGFDPDEFLGKTSAPNKSSSSIFGDKVSTQTLSGLVTGKEPPKTTGFGTFVREAGLNVPATMAGIGAGEFTTAVTVPVLGPAAPVAGLVVGGATAFGVSYLGEAGMDELEAIHPYAQKLMQLMGVDHNTRKAGREEHEYAALGGQLASGGPFMSTAAKNVGQRLVGGGINVGVGGGTRAAFGEDQDIKKSAMEFAAGAAMPGTLSKTGERIPGVRKTEPITTKKPTTPEEIDAFKAKVKEEKAKRDAAAPLTEAAIRNKETGEIERMGPKHDEQRKAETADTHDQGFVDNRNNFHDREAAVDQAKRAGQIPEDHVLEIPEDGLHSGDLRKAGDERFAITENQPAGVPKGPVQFKDKTTPTWEELHDHLDGASSVGEAFDRILSTDGLGTKSQRALLTVLNQSEFIRDASLMYNKDYLEYVDANGKTKKDAAGLYENNTHTVQLAKDGDIRVLAHEAMHAGTHRLIQEGKSAAAIKLKELHKLFLEKHNAEYDAALAKFKQENLAPTIGELKQFEKENRKAYGLVNVDEFVAEAFTNDKFKELLSSLKATAPQKGVLSNMWQAFKDAVKEGLGVPENQRTVFDEVIEHGSALVEESKGFKRDSSGTITLVPSKLSQEKLATKTSEPVAKAFEKVDPRSVPNEEEMIKHATDIHERFGEEEAVKFFEDYQKDLNERSIPVPNNKEQLEDAFHKVSTFATKDRSEHTVGYNKTSIGDLGERPSILNPIERSKWDKEAARRLKEMNELREAAFLVRENGGKVSGELGKVLDAIDAENIALVRKIKAMGGDVGEEFVTGQSRIRMFSEKEKPGWKETIKNFFDNNAPMGDKVADQVNSAIERKVYQTDDGRVIEFHRQPKDVTTPKGEIKQGTQIFEWKNKQKRLIGSSDDINFKRGDKFTVNGKELTVVDGKVPEIEKHSTYKYWHDAEASARIANMGLRKMARELELLNNLKQSELFKQVAHGPDQDPKTLPSHYVQPKNIGMIPQLRGWAFDPKTAAIIDDFAKVWDNTMWMKATNAIVKNMMLNPVPHMFNEVMHLWNARGFTGWVDPRQLATFADTARIAWRDVGNQTQFYRDIMREGGSVLGADPRNNKYFQAIQKEAQKQMFETPEMQRSIGQLAKKLGTSVGDLYNGISNASQKAMWFTRDVMYVQYIREIMARQEKSTGVKMELKDAIAQAEKHMPNYRMPSEVLNSRTIAKVLKNPNIALFSRYHYGMVKSLVNTVKDVDPRNLRTPEGRAHFREGVDSMLAIGVAMGVLYPLMDAMAEAVFGEGAEQRRAGPFHLLQAGLDVYEGKKDTTALIYPVFTFNPVLLTLGQLGFNKKLFTGKEIFHPDDDFENIAGDIGTYAVKQLPQAAPIMSATAEEGGDTKLLARQFDIKVETEEEKKRKERALKAKAQKKKTRDTQRAKGTYNP